MKDMEFNVKYIKFGKNGNKLNWDYSKDLDLVSLGNSVAIDFYNAVSNSEFGVPVDTFIIRWFRLYHYDLVINGAIVLYSNTKEEFILKLRDMKRILAFINGR